MTDNYPFEPPEFLSSGFREVLSYWTGLCRGQAKIPFSDDIKLSALPGHENDLLLLDALAKPQRFRFSLIGKNVVHAYGRDVAGLFLDELEPRPPFALIHSQASAASEMCAPTYFAHNNCARLLLPAWGDGHVSALLGIVVPLNVLS